MLLMKIAAKYRASVEAPPEQYLIVGSGYQGQGQNGSHSKEFNTLRIPEGYKLNKVDYQYSLRKSGNSNVNAQLIIGNVIKEIQRQGNSSSGYPTKGGGTYYSYSILNYTTDSIPISFTGWDVGAYSFTVSVTCFRTDELYQNWQLKTYEAIINAYNDRLNEYYNQLSQNQPEPLHR